MSQSPYSRSWFQKASVRDSSVIIFNAESELPFFPVEMLPMCHHPLIKDGAPAAKDYLLLQSCYKYLQEICITETDVVNPASLKIAYEEAPVKLDKQLHADAFSIITDEAFHSYVARTFMLQIEEHTGVAPLKLPRGNEVTKAIARIKSEISADMQDDFELVATCISENVFTDEIIEVSRMKDVNESFHKVMVDHARDEGRHAGYFIRVMRAYWEQASDIKKQALSMIIPKFIDYCFDGTHEAEFLRYALSEYGFSESEIQVLIDANSDVMTQKNRDARLKNINKFLSLSGLLDHAPLVEAMRIAEVA